DGLRGALGRPADLPERGCRGPAALSGVRPSGRELADRAALRRRARDRHDGNRPGCRHIVRRQPAAAPRASHPPGEPGWPGRDAAVRRLDHRGRHPDTGWLGLTGHRVRADPVAARPWRGGPQAPERTTAMPHRGGPDHGNVTWVWLFWSEGLTGAGAGLGLVRRLPSR